MAETKISESPRRKSAWVENLGYWFACPIVIDPFGRAYYRWQMIISAAVMYNVLAVPARMGYEQLRDPKLDVLWLALDYTCDFLYLSDILWHLYIGIPRKGIPAADLRISRKQYFRSTQFKLDILSIIPTDFLYFVWGIRMAALRLNRLLRFHRVQELFERTHVHSTYAVYFRFLQVVLYSIIVIHFNCCAYYALNYWQGFGFDLWTFPNYANSTMPEEGNFINLYLRSFQWALVVLAKDVDGLVYANWYECVLRIFVTLEGTFLLGAGIAIAEHLLAAKNRHLEAYRHHLDAVKQYMALRDVDEHMQKRVRAWFNFVWEQKMFTDEQADLEILPPILRLAIAKISFQDTFQRVKLFRGCEPQALEEFIMRLERHFYGPGDLVFRKGEVAREMYIVRTGILHVVSEDGSEVYGSLSQGSVFGEVSLLSGFTKVDPLRTQTVRSQTYSELFTLSKQDFQEVLESFPLAKKALVERGRPSGRMDSTPEEEQNKSTTEHRLDKLEETTPDLNEKMEEALAKMIEETNDLKRHLAKLEKLDKLEHQLYMTNGVL